MEIFKSTNFDFLGKKWPFIIASLILTVAGLGSIALKGGLRYGIDFRSGAVMRVQFAYAPPLDKIRSAMAQKVRGEVSVQNFSGTGAQNQVEIGTELQGQDETQLNVNRQAMQDVLKGTLASLPAASSTSTTRGPPNWPAGCAIRWPPPM
jgi:preprotein translocase subunit SecF